jgi:hypothetical protein
MSCDRIVLAMTTGTALLLTATADAELIGPCVERVREAIVIDGAAWDVWRVYIEVDDPDDAIEFVSGNADHPLVIESLDGPFYQNEEIGANDTEPNGLLFGVLPDLEWDTFVTVGRATLDFDAGPTVTQFVFPPTGAGFGESTLFVDGGAGYRLPGNPATVAGPEGRVLIGQFTIPHGGRLEGICRIAARIDGVPRLFLDQAFATPETGDGDCSGQPPTPPEDTDGDGDVDVDDLVNVMLDWGTDGSMHNGDVTGDGYVDADDLIAVILAIAPPA